MLENDFSIKLYAIMSKDKKTIYSTNVIIYMNNPLLIFFIFLIFNHSWQFNIILNFF